jgi:hypothetical protein
MVAVQVGDTVAKTVKELEGDEVQEPLFVGLKV